MSAADAPRPVRFENLRFILSGNKRGLAVLSMLALVAAACEAFLLGAVVQSISALNAGRSDVALGAGPVDLTLSASTLLGLAAGAALLRGLLVEFMAFTGPRLAASSRERHRRRLLVAYLRADWATQSADKSGRLLQTLTNAVNDANTVIALTTQALPAFLTLVVLLVVALVLSPAITGVLVVLGLVIGLGLRPLSRRANRASRADAAGRNATASHVAGVIAAGAEISVLGSRQGVVDVGLERIGATERAFARAQGLKRVVAMAGQSLAFLLAAAGLWVLSVSRWEVDFATVGTITILLLRGAGLAQQVQSASTQYGAMIPFIEQVQETISHYETRRQSFGSADFPQTYDLELHDVQYTYPGSSDPAVTVRSGRFAQGSSVAILGPSGSGKSTLIQLLLRLRRPTSGRLTIGGLDLDAIDEAQFSAHVAYVPQAPRLVPGTIAENIVFFRPGFSQPDVVRAARLAHVHDDIEGLSDGYDTVLDAHVDTLSGGQKQRLALARALLADPVVLVLDEPTSALDSENEEAVIDTLRRLHGRTTVIMITHRLSTVAHCDEVLRLAHGNLLVVDPGQINADASDLASDG